MTPNPDTDTIRALADALERGDVDAAVETLRRDHPDSLEARNDQ